MNIPKHLSLIIGLLSLLLINNNCTRAKHLKEQKLAKLKQQEEVLVAELEEYVQPPIWNFLKEEVVKEVKEYPPAAKHQFKTSRRMYNDLTQALEESKAGNLDAQEKVAAGLAELIEEGFKAETVEQGIKGLEKWIALLQNLKQQYELINS